MLVISRSTTSTKGAAVSASFLLLFSNQLVRGVAANRSTHHKAAAAANLKLDSPKPNSRSASYVVSSSSSVDNPFNMERPVNVFGRPLTQCGTNPMTGFYRDGYCNTGPADGGSHTVAAVVSQKWLDFSASKGNDLRPILSEGCSWCLCVSRWKQSLDAWKRGELPKEGVPKVKLEATHLRALDVVGLDDLREFAAPDSNVRGDKGAQDPSRGGPIR